MKELHPTFAEIMQNLIENALPAQIERERNKVVKPSKWHPEQYLEWHENNEELQECFDDYGRCY